MPSPPDYLPTAKWTLLRRRAELLQSLRAFFIARDYLEVETPLLSRDTVIDRHLDPLSVVLFPDAQQPERGPRYYLQTSPEFAMKRLLAAGSPSIFQITKAFRGAERGDWHNPEFTMLEWYGVGDNYQQGMQLLSDLAEMILGTSPARIVTYREAFQETVYVDPHTARLETLARIAGDGFQFSDRDGWLDAILTTHVAPRLGVEQPVILCDYPASQAALAQTRAEGDTMVAERFELYVRGVELANGYHELLDAQALRVRMKKNNQERIADGKPPLPEESRLASAMEHGLPSCTGCALGVDRLLMVRERATKIDDVIAFPSERA